MSNESENKENEDDCPSCGPGVGFRTWKYMMIPVPQTMATVITEEDEEAKSILKKTSGDVDATVALEPFPVLTCTECTHVFRDPVRGEPLWSDVDNLLLDLGFFMKKSDPEKELEIEFVEGPYY